MSEENIDLNANLNGDGEEHDHTDLVKSESSVGSAVNTSATVWEQLQNIVDNEARTKQKAQTKFVQGMFGLFDDLLNARAESRIRQPRTAVETEALVGARKLYLVDAMHKRGMVIEGSDKDRMKLFEEKYPEEVKQVQALLGDLQHFGADTALSPGWIDSGTFKNLAKHLDLSKGAADYMDYRMTLAKHGDEYDVTPERLKAMEAFKQEHPKEAHLVERMTKTLYNHITATKPIITVQATSKISQTEKFADNVFAKIYKHRGIDAFDAKRYIKHQMSVRLMLGHKKPITQAEKEVAKAFEKAHPKDAKMLNKVLTQLENFSKKTSEEATLKKMSAALDLPKDTVDYMVLELGRLQNYENKNFLTPGDKKYIKEFEANSFNAGLAKALVQELVEQKKVLLEYDPLMEDKSELGLLKQQQKKHTAAQEKLLKLDQELSVSDIHVRAHKKELRGLSVELQQREGNLEDPFENLENAFPNIGFSKLANAAANKVHIEEVAKQVGISLNERFSEGATRIKDRNDALSAAVKRNNEETKQALKSRFYDPSRSTIAKNVALAIVWPPSVLPNWMERAKKRFDRFNQGVLIAGESGRLIVDVTHKLIKDIRQDIPEIEASVLEYRDVIVAETLNLGIDKLSEKDREERLKLIDEFKSKHTKSAEKQKALLQRMNTVVAQHGELTEEQKQALTKMMEAIDRCESVYERYARAAKEQATALDKQKELQDRRRETHQQINDLALTEEDLQRMKTLSRHKMAMAVFTWGVLPLLVGGLALAAIVFLAPVSIPLIGAAVLAGMATLITYAALWKSAKIIQTGEKALVKMAISKAVSFITGAIPGCPRINFNFNFDPRSVIASRSIKWLAPILLTTLLTGGLAFPAAVAVVAVVSIVAYVAIRYYAVDKFFSQTWLGRGFLKVADFCGKQFNHLLEGTIKYGAKLGSAIYNGVASAWKFLTGKSNTKIAQETHQAVAESLGIETLKLPTWGEENFSGNPKTALQKAIRQEWKYTERSATVAADDTTWLSGSVDLKTDIESYFQTMLNDLDESGDDHANRMIISMLRNTLQQIRSIPEGNKEAIAVELLALYEALDACKLDDGFSLADVAREDPSVVVLMKEFDKMLGVSESVRKDFMEHKVEHRTMLAKLKNQVKVLREAQLGEADLEKLTQLKNQLVLCEDAVARLESTVKATDKPLLQKDYDEQLSWLTGVSDKRSLGRTIKDKQEKLLLKADMAGAASKKNKRSVKATVSGERLRKELAEISRELGEGKRQLKDMEKVFSAKNSLHYAVSKVGNDLDELNKLMESMEKDSANQKQGWGDSLLGKEKHSPTAVSLQNNNKATLRKVAKQLDNLEHDIVAMENRKEEVEDMLDRVERLLNASPPKVKEARDIMLSISVLEDLGLREEIFAKLSTSALEDFKEKVVAISKYDDEAIDANGEVIKGILLAHVKDARGHVLAEMQENFSFAKKTMNEQRTLHVYSDSDQAKGADSHRMVVRLHILLTHLEKAYGELDANEQFRHIHVKLMIDALQGVLRSEEGFDSAANRAQVTKAYASLKDASVKLGDVLGVLGSIIQVFKVPGLEEVRQTQMVSHGQSTIGRTRIVGANVSKADSNVENILLNIKVLQEKVVELQYLETQAQIKIAESDPAKIDAMEVIVQETAALLAELKTVEMQLKKREIVNDDQLAKKHEGLQERLEDQIQKIDKMMDMVRPDVSLGEVLGELRDKELDRMRVRQEELPSLEDMLFEQPFPSKRAATTFFSSASVVESSHVSTTKLRQEPNGLEGDMQSFSAY